MDGELRAEERIDIDRIFVACKNTNGKENMNKLVQRRKADMEDFMLALHSNNTVYDPNEVR